jgi:8-oxo-dGTP diphosphatase
MRNNIHIIARALIFDSGHILLVREKSSTNSFLPGGHIEENEEITIALTRELKEEFNGVIELGDFAGVIENFFHNGKEDQHEINFLFIAKLLNFAFPENPISNESYLEFFWHPIASIETANVLPTPVIEFIINSALSANPQFASVRDNK